MCVRIKKQFDFENGKTEVRSVFSKKSANNVKTFQSRSSKHHFLNSTKTFNV